MEAMNVLRNLEQLQTRILQRITELELSLHSRRLSSLSLSSNPGPADSALDGDEATVSKLSNILRSLSVSDFVFKRVPFDYYDQSIEARRDILGAPSIHHLCKSIVLVNTQAPADVTDCSNRNNSKYYVVVIQYMARLNAESIRNFLYSLNNQKIAKKKFNLRLAPEEDSAALTGYIHNAVTCVGMQTDIPVIIDEAILKLEPDFFWLGGGEVDLKLGIRTPEFIGAVNPFVVNCSLPL